jgi:hypothetical protein
LGVRFLTGDTHPDHDTICTFRRENAKLITKFFVRVLKLARELKLLEVGTISVDGSGLKANASKLFSPRKNVSVFSGELHILGAYLSQSSADNNELEPMVKAVSDNLGQKPQSGLSRQGLYQRAHDRANPRPGH